MKSIKTTGSLLRGAFVAVLLQGVTLITADARPNERVPSSVTNLDTAAHNLVDSYQRDLKRDHGRPNRSEWRFLEAAKAVENRAHELRGTVENDRGAHAAQNNIASVRRAYDELSEASRNVRLNDRSRNLLSQVRISVRNVEEDRQYIYASASPSGGRHDHRHRDNDRRPGLLGRILFGK